MDKTWWCENEDKTSDCLVGTEETEETNNLAAFENDALGKCETNKDDRSEGCLIIDNAKLLGNAVRPVSNQITHDYLEESVSSHGGGVNSPQIYFCSVCEKVKEGCANHNECDKVVHINDKLKETLETITSQPELILSESDRDSPERVRDFEQSKESTSSLLERVLNVSRSCQRSEVRALRDDLVYQLRGYALQELQFGTRRYEPKRFKLILEDAVAMLDGKNALLRGLDPPQIPCESDFGFVRLLNEGSIGKVLLAKKIDEHGKLCAVKVMNKKYLLRNNLGRLIVRERRVMSHTNSRPNLFPRLLSSFQDEERLFLVMEYIEGGTCLMLLHAVGAIPENLVRHYVAEVCLAADFLHRHGVIHRDIKPDNLLLTASGHVKITDFGLSSRISHRSRRATPVPARDDVSESTSVGNTWENSPVDTPNNEREDGVWNGFDDIQDEKFDDNNGGDLSVNKQLDVDEGLLYTVVGSGFYQAPEMVLECGYDEGLDWWAIGVLTYHLLAGVTPFEGDNVQQTLVNIAYNSRRDWSFMPTAPSYECMEFISGLLEPVRSERMGGHRSTREALRHEFFEGLDLETLHSRPGPLLPHSNPHVFVWMKRHTQYETYRMNELVSEKDWVLEMDTRSKLSELNGHEQSTEDESCFENFSYVCRE